MSRRPRHFLKGKKKDYEVWGFRKAVDRIKKNGDLTYYMEKELEKVEKEAELELEEAKKEEEKKIQALKEFEEELERESREFLNGTAPTLDSTYYIPKDPNVDNKAFIVTFNNHPAYTYIAFTKTRDKARAAGQKWVRDNFFPTYSTNECPVSLKEATARRLKELDQYARKGQAPIPAILKIGMQFTCSICGKDHFDYSDYEIKRCFIIEGEGDVVPYAEGMIVCYDCYKKYFN